MVTAFQNVADVLQAIELDGQSLQIASAATRDARENLCLTVAGFAGYDGHSAELKHVHPDTPESRDEIFQRLRGWWDSVCSADPKFESHLKDLLSNDKSDSPPSGIDVVTSEQLFLATRLSFVTAKAALDADVVALFQALGGGWWNRTDVDEPEQHAWIADSRSE